MACLGLDSRVAKEREVTGHLSCIFSQGDKMKPELKQWVVQRLSILKALEA